MPLSASDVARIKRMDDDELLSHAESFDLAVGVMATLHLHHTTRRLNRILIWLTVALVFLTAGLVVAAFPWLSASLGRFV